MINHKFILYNEIKSKDYINLEAYSEDEFIRISDEFIKNNSYIVKNNFLLYKNWKERM